MWPLNRGNCLISAFKTELTVFLIICPVFFFFFFFFLYIIFGYKVNVLALI